MEVEECSFNLHYDVSHELERAIEIFVKYDFVKDNRGRTKREVYESIDRPEKAPKQFIRDSLYGLYEIFFELSGRRIYNDNTPYPISNSEVYYWQKNNESRLGAETIKAIFRMDEAFIYSYQIATKENEDVEKAKRDF